MSEYEIIDTQVDTITGCALCGYKSQDNEGHRRKAAWLKKRYAEGLRYKVIRSPECGDVGMIEYAPGTHAWRPVEAEGYLVIHCLMVHPRHKGKGFGALLLEDCLQDAWKCHCRGVAVVASTDSFMAGRDVFVKAGLVPVASLPPYELLVKKLQKTAPDPRFLVAREPVLKKYKQGLTILAADQCPMIPKCVADIAEASRALGLEPKVVHVQTARASRQLPTPYGMFSVIYNGNLLADRPVSGTRFRNIMRTRHGLCTLGPARN